MDFGKEKLKPTEKELSEIALRILNSFNN
jgi:hypothetical protein